MPLLHPFHLPAAPALAGYLPGIRSTHPKPPRQFPQTSVSTVVRLQQLAPQIVGISSSHRLRLVADLSPTTLYTNMRSALDWDEARLLALFPHSPISPSDPTFSSVSPITLPSLPSYPAAPRPAT